VRQGGLHQGREAARAPPHWVPRGGGRGKEKGRGGSKTGKKMGGGRAGGRTVCILWEGWGKHPNRRPILLPRHHGAVKKKVGRGGVNPQ